MNRPVLVSVPSQDWVAQLGPLAGTNVVAWDLLAKPPANHVDIVMAPFGAPQRLVALKDITTWLVQGPTLGHEAIPGNLPSGHRYANARGTHETATAELAIALLLAAQRELPRLAAAQRDRHWQRILATGLADSRILLVGYGGLGQAIESRLRGFEVSIQRVASRERRQPDGTLVFGPEALTHLAASADCLVVCAGLTPSSQNLISAPVLAALPEGALVVNVGRGSLIDASALEAELISGRLRAALDVTDPEPLPPQSPLWALPNLIITPHVGGHTAAQFPRLTSLLQRQIRALQDGREPENIVVDHRV